MSAYEILESEGFVETIKGKGTFVKKNFLMRNLLKFHQL